MKAAITWCCSLVLLLIWFLGPAKPLYAQQDQAVAGSEVSSEQQSGDTARRQRPKPWIGFDSKPVNARFIALLGVDFFQYVQDAAGIGQVGDLTEFERPEIRAVRFASSGTINFKRPWTWLFSVAYRGSDSGLDRPAEKAWSIFDLAFTIPIWKIGWMTAGKAKEPISNERLMRLIDLPFMERSIGGETFLPSRNIGIQLGNSFAHKRMSYAVGWFDNWIETSNSFGEGNNQYLGRLTALPIASRRDDGSLLHLAFATRFSNVKIGHLRYKAKPETFNSTIFVDTGDFPAESATYLQGEVGYRRGPLWLMSETLYNMVEAPEVGDPRFYSFTANAAWTLTGESRGYDRRRGIFKPLEPKHSIFGGGPGLWEIGTRYSRVDLTDQQIHGGEMWRLTGIVKWYPNRNIMTTFDYGIARLYRDQIWSTTHIFQVRLLLWI